MLSGEAKHITELPQITEDLKQTVAEKVVAHSGVEARPDVVGTSGKDKEKRKETEKVTRPFLARRTDMKVMVEIPRQDLNFKSSGSPQKDVESPIIHLNVEKIPLETLGRLYMHAYEVLRWREEIKYQQK